MSVPSLILREHVQRAGLPGLGGAALLALVLGYGMFGLLPDWQSLDTLRQNSHKANEFLEKVANGTATLPVVPSQQLDEFHKALPTQLDATTVIDRIYAMASKEKINLARGEYALGIDPKTQLARYQILLPVRGNYPQLRRFLHALLTELPAVVVEDVDFQRKRIADTELSGRIRMTLYLSRS
ncbi:type II secretion system protein M [Pseudomonas putida]|uniref:GspMb/PilO family protein n=1 Tax=Pseudomonas putida TaxID=303 RepID=UPI002364846F|nr:type 4a pilus biogenesis protein PilO [Pseudomonas putida]MDD1964342.1 type II secretion system protein M [Pseudomonas putida]